jgi:hypothetical protein
MWSFGGKGLVRGDYCKLQNNIKLDTCNVSMALHVVDGHFNNLDLTNSVRVSLVKWLWLMTSDHRKPHR